MKKSALKRRAILDAAYRLFRAQGFDKTSIAEITALAGGSKATIYSHFRSKEVLFVECMMAAVEDYMSSTLKHLDTSADPRVALEHFGTSVLNFLCSPERPEAARSGTGKLFFDKIAALRTHVSAFLSACMQS